MFDKIINYGCSFTVAESCECAEEDIWFRHALKEYPADKFINRAIEGQAIDMMCLEAVHDCLSQQGKLLQIFSIPPITRLPTWTDGWYGEAKLKPLNDKGQPNKLEDCQKYFAPFSASDIAAKLEPHIPNNDIGTNITMINTDKSMQENIRSAMRPMFHPVLRWARLYSNILQLDTLSPKHGNKIVFAHMHYTEDEYSVNPLITPLEERVKQMPNYFDESISCDKICFEAGIDPVDADTFGRQGHHGAAGHEYFGKFMSDRIKKIL
tara:strand:- start:558 stop:1355 length:798 start_codon:yes stop_codon:yes gene_type:complete